MKKSYLLLLIPLVLVLLILIKIFHKTIKTSPAASKPATEALLAECLIARDTLVGFSFNAVGHTTANESVELVSELSLRLMSIHFREGSQVKKGDLLFRLDDSELQASLKKVEAKRELAKQTVERNGSILATGGLSRQTYDESVSHLKALEAEKELLQATLAKTRIVAPFSGTLGIRHVSEGAFLTPGTRLVTLEDISRLRIRFSVPETYSGMIQKGAVFSFRAEGYPEPFQAVIEAFNPSVEKSTGNLEVLAFVKEDRYTLKPGITVIISMESKAAAPAVYLPTQALIPTPGGYHVYALKDGKAESRNITTGIRSEKMVEITDGVNPGDSILVTGFMRIRPGVAVRTSKIW